MGYNTDFRGGLSISPEPSQEFTDYINEFSDIRHMAIDVDKMVEMFPESKKLGRFFTDDFGTEGEFVVLDLDNTGYVLRAALDNKETPVIDHNEPPKGVPGLWCQWVIEDGELVWDGAEKFYNYIEWLEYMIVNFFKPAGYTLNGVIEWRGEDWDDTGKITVTDNKIEVEYV